MMSLFGGQHDSVNQTDIVLFACLVQTDCSTLATTGTGWTNKHEEAEPHLSVGLPLRDSLLDIAESQRAGTWSEVGVRVVVQRTYFLLSRDSAPGQQGHNVGLAGSSGAR